MFKIFKRPKAISRPDPHLAESVPEYNRKLDTYLLSTGIVDVELYSGFQDAYGYNAAGTFNWLNAKIDVLQSRINQGKSIYIYDPVSKATVELRHTAEFCNWLKLNFPDV